MASNEHGHQIHMTAEESDRMRKTVQERIQKCNDQRGQLRESRESRDAISFATQSSLMADMAGEVDPGMSVYSGRDAIVALAIGPRYPPSSTSLPELKPIKLAELQLDTHHLGRVLEVKKVAPDVPLLAYSWTIVEDEAKDVERLEVYLHKYKRGEGMIDSGPHFKIKEPYFTLNEQGEPTIRIHHPSDLVRVRKSAPIGKGSIVEAAERCKTRGNNALKKKEYVEAADHYADGLKLAEGDAEAQESIARDLYRNRAHVNIILGRLDEAKADGKAAITGKDDEKLRSLDSKANFRAGTAAYNLGDFLEAKQLFQQALDLSPEDKEAKVYLRNITTRLKEQETGDFDFGKIRSRLAPAKPRVDAGTYLGPTIIKESNLGGRGLFAANDIEPGDLILCEKAFAVAWSHEKDAWTAMTYDTRDDKIRAFPAGLSKVLVQKLLNNPSQVGKLTKLYADHKGVNQATIPSGEENPIVDSFTVHDIICRNAFGPGAITIGGNQGTEDARTASTGIWIHAAYINHSCVPNAKKDFLGDLMIIRALKPIPAGSEITHAYDENPDVDSRAAALQTTWGFECQCPLCAAEKQDAEEVRAKRRELYAQSVEFVQKEHAGSAKRLLVASAERLAKAIDGTYEKERYAGLPRTAMGPILAWLEVAKKGR